MVGLAVPRIQQLSARLQSSNSWDIEEAMIIPCTDRKNESCWSNGLFLQNYQTICGWSARMRLKIWLSLAKLRN